MAETVFSTVLHSLKSPQNVGLITRSHVAFGGDKLVFLGYPLPWEYKKGSQAFSRKLEKQCDILHFVSDDKFFEWCNQYQYTPIAMEISAEAKPLPDYKFPKRVALVVGNEALGLPELFLFRCSDNLLIPQFGDVGSLNVAISASIAMYEVTRVRRKWRLVAGDRYVGKLD